MDFKYKIADVAKEFGVPAKKVIETVTGVTGEAYKTGGTLRKRAECPAGDPDPRECRDKSGRLSRQRQGGG